MDVKFYDKITTKKTKESLFENLHILMNLETLNPKLHTHMFLCDVPTIQGTFVKQFFKNCG